MRKREKQMLTMIVALQMLAKDRLDREEGATMVEYDLLVALIAVIVAVGAKLLGEGIDTLFDSVTTSLN